MNFFPKKIDESKVEENVNLFTTLDISMKTGSHY